LKKQVIITIKSKQTVDNEDQVVELVTPGKFYKKGNTYYALYDETEISGMEGTTTTLKIEGDEVHLIRFGTMSTNMRFKMGVTDVSLYKSPYGIIELTVKPLSVAVDVGDSGGEVKMRYELIAGGEQKSTNELLIKIHSKGDAHEASAML